MNGFQDQHREKVKSSMHPMHGTLHSLMDATAVRAVAATAVLVPLAALVGGVKLDNHNETFLRDA